MLRDLNVDYLPAHHRPAVGIDLALAVYNRQKIQLRIIGEMVDDALHMVTPGIRLPDSPAQIREIRGPCP